MKKVVIANFGYTTLAKPQYDALAVSVTDALKNHKVKVEITTSPEKIDDSATTVVFLSWGGIVTAKKLKHDYPLKKVVIFTGIPFKSGDENGGMIFVHKNSKDGVEKLVSEILN